MGNQVAGSFVLTRRGSVPCVRTLGRVEEGEEVVCVWEGKFNYMQKSQEEG